MMKETHRSKERRAWSIFRPIILVALAALLTAASPVLATRGNGADEQQVELQSGPFAPGASGEVAFSVRGGVLAGHIEAKGLPAQGVHAFYVLWFVRTDTGNKAFLGPLVSDESILFTKPGDGEMRFMAHAFTDGRNTGSPISLGTAGNNFFVVIAENQIDTRMPFPVSAPPSSFALTATF